jgi:hypothetical protein
MAQKKKIEIGQTVTCWSGKNKIDTIVVGKDTTGRRSWTIGRRSWTIIVELDEYSKKRLKGLGYYEVVSGAQLLHVYRSSAKDHVLRRDLVDPLKHYTWTASDNVRIYDPLEIVHREILYEIYVGEHMTPSGVLLHKIKPVGKPVMMKILPRK